MRLFRVFYLTMVSVAADMCLFLLKKIKKILIFPGG